ncbi:MAG: hypothetical protein C0502_00420 [Opitutus sp.]|nr:hypothetical protein [Opitutus sp.]
MQLCHIVPSLEERHGGPSKSVRALADALSRQGASVDLLTTHPAGAGPAAPGSGGAGVRSFPRRWPQALYRSPELSAHLRASSCDLVHHHSLWLLTLRYATEASRARNLPLVISPRGMMTGWAWNHHRGRKRIARALIHPQAFEAAAGWHATSEAEAADIRRLGFQQPVCVAPNGVTVPEDRESQAARAHWFQAEPRLAERRVAVFYSRFHRKKRLRELVELWQDEPRGDWLLLLVGVPEEFGVDEIGGWISPAARDAVIVSDGRNRPPPYAAASLFLLPSHSENFGLSIAEALAAGIPPLVTDATPWSGLDARDAGWCVPWSEYAATLRLALAESPAALARRGDAGRRWVAEEYTWEASARSLLGFYRQLVRR